METLNLEVNSGLVQVNLTDSEGDVVGSFKFNPSDFDIIKRYEGVADALKNFEVEDDSNESFFKASDFIKEQFNVLLGGNVSEGIFGSCNPLNIVDDGSFYFEKVMEVIEKVIESKFDTRLKKSTEKINKAVAKYRKK